MGTPSGVQFSAMRRRRDRDAVRLAVLREVEVHCPRFVARELVVLGYAAHEVEAVGVPVVPVVPALLDLEELNPARAAMAGRAGGKVRAGPDELLRLRVVLPIGDVGPHEVVVRPEVLVPDHERGVYRVQLAKASGSSAE